MNFSFAPPWNSLELAKLVVAAATPVIVACIGFWISRRLKRLEQLQWSRQKLIEKRLEVHTSLAPLLNHLYCYFDYIGDWKFAPPTAALRLKRKADRLFFVHEALFSSNFRTAYREFINLCFDSGPREEHHTSARLRTEMAPRKDIFKRRQERWDPRWDEHFVATEPLPLRSAVRSAYKGVTEAFADDLGVETTTP